MHYKNGREAKNGDKVIWLSEYGNPIVGVLYDAIAGNDYCNGKIALINNNDPCPNLKEVLHIDDLKEIIILKEPVEKPHYSAIFPEKLIKDNK